MNVSKHEEQNPRNSGFVVISQQDIIHLWPLL